MSFLLKEKYINLLTDFGFKRVFGTEPNQQLLIDFLNTLLPAQHRIQSVTYKHFSPVEQEGYQESLKYYRDLNNVVDTSW